MTRSRRRTWGMRLTAFAISLIIAIFTLEIVVRVASDEGTTLLVKDPAVGQRYQANFVGAKFVPEAGKTIALRFNRDGFRGPDRSYEKPKHVRRIAVLGDSFIAGIAVDESETFVCQLEKMLNANNHSDERWEVMNFGVSGSGTGQQRLIYKEVARKYKPDVVLLCFFVGNDFADNSPTTGAANRPVYALDREGTLFLHQPSIERTSFSRWLAETSHLYVWQKNKIRILRDRVRESFGIISPGEQIFCTAPDAVASKTWTITEKLIDAVADDVRADNASFALALLPAHEQVIKQRWANMLASLKPEQMKNYRKEYPDERISQICKSKGIALLRIGPAFHECTDPGKLFFQSEGHWTREGNQLAAKSISSQLTPLQSAHVAN